MTRRRISPTLVMEGASLCCAACGHTVGVAGQPWKQNAALRTTPASALPGAGTSLNPDLMVRSFACRGCAALLDSEVALSGDPFLDDVVDA